MMITTKIQEQHREKAAYVYLRQSTPGQLRFNRESTERQYALKNKAFELGWPIHKVKVLDGDLGISGAQMSNREDFKTLVADVSMSKVGAIFALEASRLSRSCTDWHRLLEICSLTGTLIIDEDGCYNPSDFNDQLLLGLKGSMSQAELHFIRARLQGGKLNKAKKGELRFSLPVGLSHGDENKITLDPDEEVRNIVSLVFQSFKETGSAYAVVQKFSQMELKFPKRAYGGVWKGKLIWGRLTHSRVRSVIKNPAYAGAYVYGRFRYQKKISPEGKIQSKVTLTALPSWQVTIQGHHEAYISWEEYLHNQRILERNRTNGETNLLRGPAREGAAILQGLLLCGICGRGVYPRYTGNGGIYPTYQCNWRKREGLCGNACICIRADLLDDAVSKKILEILQPAQIEIALNALKELEHRNQAIDRQWKMRIERADYESQLAQRRYEEVDPSNRLVASTLERRWNDTLASLEQVRQEYEQYQQKEVLHVTSEQRKQILSLGQDLPQLWKAPSTQPKDRKRILRLLVKDITVRKLSDPKKVALQLRWQGGACEELFIDLPPSMADRLRYPDQIIAKVQALASTLRDTEIVTALNKEGLMSAKGRPFTVDMVEWIRFKHRIPSPVLKRPEELTVKQVAQKFNVNPQVVYYWMERNHIPSRRINGGTPRWITLTPEKKMNCMTG
jgi:DNA invertase Pin-like site-specific DNA recombinase